MKALLLLSLISFNLMASEEAGLSGFVTVKNNSKAMTLNFQDEMQFVISKAKFKSQNQAEKFCKDQKSALDTEFNSMLIAMSGATEENKFLDKSISIKITNPKDKSDFVTGIAQWSGKDNTIAMAKDGGGSEVGEVSIAEMSKYTKAELPAICVKKLK